MPAPAAAVPILAMVLARGSSIFGRLAMGAGRALASQGAKGAGRALQRTGASLQRYSRRTMAQAMQPGRPAGRRPVTPRGQRGRRSRGRQRQSVSFSQAFRRAARQGARNTIQQQRKQDDQGGFFGSMFAPKSYLGRIARNYGSAQHNFRQGNTLQGVADSTKVAADVSKPVVAVAVAMVAMPKLIKEWGASLVESKRHLGEFSAAYSVAAGRLDIQRFQRNVRFAGATQGSYRNLTQAQNRLEEKLAPYAIAANNALLKVVTLLVNVGEKMVTVAETAAVVTGWAPIIEGLAKKFGLTGAGGGAVNQPLADLAQALARGNFAKRVKPPMPRGGGGPAGA